MCVHIPFGYSLQTIIKTIACFEIVLASICLILSGIFGTIVLISPSSLKSLLLLNDETTDLKPSTSPATIIIINDNDTANENVTAAAASPDVNNLARFLNANSSFQASVFLMLVIYFLCGLSLAILLLSAAQERHLQKLTVWMILQTLVNILRLFCFILWFYWIASLKKCIDLILCAILLNFYSFTVLSIVNSHRQEIASLYERDKRSRKRKQDEEEQCKERFIRNI